MAHVTTCCDDCPVGCRGSEPCPMRVRFMGKPVAFLVRREYEEDYLTAHDGDPRVFMSLDEAKAFVESQRIVAVGVPRQNWERTGKAAPTQWYDCCSDVFEDAHEPDVSPCVPFQGDEPEDGDAFDPTFASCLESGMSRHDIMMANVRSPHSSYFYHDYMTRWYRRDEITDVALATFKVDGFPYAGIYREFGRQVIWFGHPFVVCEPGYLRSVLRPTYYFTISMVEIGVGLS